MRTIGADSFWWTGKHEVPSGLSGEEHVWEGIMEESFQWCGAWFHFPMTGGNFEMDEDGSWISPLLLRLQEPLFLFPSALEGKSLGL